MTFIEGAELNIYSSQGENLSISLSEKQLFILVKILGLKWINEDTFNCFSDETLDKIIKMQGNPLKLKQI